MGEQRSATGCVINCMKRSNNMVGRQWTLILSGINKVLKANKINTLTSHIRFRTSHPSAHDLPPSISECMREWLSRESVDQEGSSEVDHKEVSERNIIYRCVDECMKPHRA